MTSKKALDPVEQEFQKLLEEYKASIPEKSSAIQKAIDDIIYNFGKKQQPSFKELEKLTHKLAGSSGSYGFQVLSVLSQVLESHICDGKIQKLTDEDCISFLRFWYALFSEQARLASLGKQSHMTAEKLLDILHSQMKSKRLKKEEAA